MSFENRGGTPIVRRLSIDTTGTAGPAGDRGLRLDGIAKWVQISNEGANALRIFFTDADFSANANYIELAASTGYYEGPDEINRIWFKAAAGSTTAVLKYNVRRG